MCYSLFHNFGIPLSRQTHEIDSLASSSKNNEPLCFKKLGIVHWSVRLGLFAEEERISLNDYWLSRNNNYKYLKNIHET